MLHVLIRDLDSECMRQHLFETDKLELATAIQMRQGMEATAADLQSWSEGKNSRPKVVATMKGITQENENGEGVMLVTRSQKDRGMFGGTGCAVD